MSKHRHIRLILLMFLVSEEFECSLSISKTFDRGAEQFGDNHYHANNTMATKYFLYFAYGSNLLRERLVLKNPSAEFKAVGRLADHELLFVGHGSRWQGGAASIQKKEGSEVWGVVWRMDVCDLPSLNSQENLYTAKEVEVKDLQEELFCCRTYQLSHLDDSDVNPPSPHYKDVIVRGARQNRLPEHYVKVLEGVRDNGYQGQLKVYDDVMALLSGGS